MNPRLKAIRERLEKATPPDSTVGDFRRFMDHAGEDTKYLLDLLDEARDGLKFYANKKNWDDRWVDFSDDSGGDVNDVISIEDVDIENIGEEGEPCLTYGGKHARETLRKIEGEG